MHNSLLFSKLNDIYTHSHTQLFKIWDETMAISYNTSYYILVDSKINQLEVDDVFQKTFT